MGKSQRSKNIFQKRRGQFLAKSSRTSSQKIQPSKNEPFLKRNINDSFIRNPTNFFELGGGYNQEWKKFLKEIGQKEKLNNSQKKGKVSVNPDYDLEKNYQFENPIKLDPKTATSEQVSFHAERWQRLSKSSIEHRLRCARRMAKHPIYPINFNNPSYDQFIAYMDYRERYEGASGYALMNDLRTMQMFLRAYDIDLRTWYYKLPILPKHKKRIIPYPETVYELIHFQYSKDPYENALYQYLMFHNFFIGWRVPSEPCAMTIDDIDIDRKGRGSITITETKKRRSQRTIIPEKAIISATTYKSMKNWIDHWRPKVENSNSGNALYLQSNGKPFTVRYLGKKLSENGKLVWKHYQPYVSRHWCAIALLIRTKRETKIFDIRRVQKYLGHDRQKTTDGYIEFAEEYYRQDPRDWFFHALKQSKNELGGKHEKIDRPQFSGLLTDFSPVGRYGLVGI